MSSKKNVNTVAAGGAGANDARERTGAPRAARGGRGGTIEEELFRVQTELKFARSEAQQEKLEAALDLRSEKESHRATCARLAAAEKECERRHQFEKAQQRRIEALTAENAALRRELGRLRQRRARIFRTMNTIAIAKLILECVGRAPCAEACPALRLFLPFETDALAFPALIASVSTTSREPAGNATESIDARFELALDAEDFASADAAALADAVAAALTQRLTPAALNAAAAQLELPAHIYFFRRAGEEAPSVNALGKLTFALSFTGAAQF